MRNPPFAAVTYAAYRDVRSSSRAGLVLQVLSISIVVITALVVRVKGTVIDPEQLDIASFNYGSVFSALPFVIFSFAGFESSATLAKGSADPRRNHLYGDRIVAPMDLHRSGEMKARHLGMESSHRPPPGSRG
jgi:amino acid transporter